MDDLHSYLKEIVEPTIDEFGKNPVSGRHAFLACVATYHAADRVPYPNKPGNVLERWRKAFPAFVLIELIALRFKHVRSDFEKAKQLNPGIPLAHAAFGSPDDSKTIDTRNLYYLLREFVKFLHRQPEAAGKEWSANP